MFSQLLSQPPIPLNDARPGLRFGSNVEQVVMRALSKDPGHRFPDTVSFANALQRALDEEAPAETPGLLARVKSIFKR
jgi:serine/threonine-protein kinase